MAVTLFMRIPELTLDRYDRMMVELELDANPPAGLILHVASEAVGSDQRAARSGRRRRRRRASSSTGFATRSCGTG